MAMKPNKYFVQTIIGRGKKVVGYDVCDAQGGLTSAHETFRVDDRQSAEVALWLANLMRDDLNAKTV
jgi:hypothetical protein